MINGIIHEKSKGKTFPSVVRSDKKKHSRKEQKVIEKSHFVSSFERRKGILAVPSANTLRATFSLLNYRFEAFSLLRRDLLCCLL